MLFFLWLNDFTCFVQLFFVVIINFLLTPIRLIPGWGRFLLSCKFCNKSYFFCIFSLVSKCWLVSRPEIMLRLIHPTRFEKLMDIRGRQRRIRLETILYLIKSECRLSDFRLNKSLWKCRPSTYCTKTTSSSHHNLDRTRYIGPETVNSAWQRRQSIILRCGLCPLAVRIYWILVVHCL